MDPDAKNLRLKCAEIAFRDRSKTGVTDGSCLKVAQQIYEFVTGKTEKAPETDKQ